MYQSISMPEFEQLEKRNQLAILDVREADEYAQGHIHNAQLFPLSLIQDHAPSLDAEPEYYVICHSGARSAMASQYLADLGYKITNVMGGMSAWRGEVE